MSKSCGCPDVSISNEASIYWKPGRGKSDAPDTQLSKKLWIPMPSSPLPLHTKSVVSFKILNNLHLGFPRIAYGLSDS